MAKLKFYQPAHFGGVGVCSQKEWYHEHLEGILACISGPAGTWVTQAGWEGLSRVEQPCEVCLWTCEDENVFFCKWPELYLLPHHARADFASIEILLTGVEAHGKARGGSKKPSRKSKLQLSPWSTVHWELSLHISSPPTGWNWVGLAQSPRPRVEEGLLCAGWPERTFPVRASDFWTWVNGWLRFLYAALHQDTLSSQSQHWLWNACAPSSKSSGLPESSLSDSETKLFSQAQEPKSIEV